MQTFLPYPSFALSAKCLDNKRLGKQRVEVLTILRVLSIGPYQYYNAKHNKWLACPEHELHIYAHIRKTPWYNHPAVKMWRGYTNCLVFYGWFICNEWTRRGFKDTCLDKIASFQIDGCPTIYPIWINNEQFHASHRSNLLRKDPTWYKQFNWTEPNDLPYVWPVA